MEAEDDGDEEKTVGVYLLERLRRAVGMSDLGAPGAWSLERKASFSLKTAGYGGTVSISSPMSVKRAATILENHRVGGE